MNDTRPQRLELSPSGAFAGMLVAVHASAAACLLASMPGLPGMALAFLTLALGSAAAWDRALLRGSRSPRAIEIAASGPGVVAVVVLANRETVAVHAVGGIGVTRHWVALRSGSLAGRSVLVTAGMLGPGALRVLRLWALWGRTPGTVAGRVPA